VSDGRRLFLVRHAHAVDTAPLLGDAGRYLTGKGRKVMREVARDLVGKGIDEIWTSPLVRAVQTAEILASALGLEDDVVVRAVLGPGHEPKDVLRAVDEQAPKGRCIALVGHEPDLSELASAVLGGPFGGFKKAGVLGVTLVAPVGGGGRARVDLGMRVQLIGS